MSQPTCATCRYFGGGNRCHRSPPVWISAGDHVQPGWWQPATDMGGWCGEHAPRPDEAGPGLPKGWVFATADHHTMARHDRLGVYCEAIGSERTVISTVGYIPDDVVLAVITAHRARVGGAS